jgi:hypothetical protein
MNTTIKQIFQRENIKENKVEIHQYYAAAMDNKKRPISLGMEDSKTLQFNFEQLRKTVQTVVTQSENRNNKSNIKIVLKDSKKFICK